MPLDHLIPGMIGLLVFGLPTAYLIWLWILGRQSRAWATTSGTIIHAAVTKPSNNHSTQASASIRYQYHVDGVAYTGSRIHFGAALNFNKSDARAAVTRYPRGATVTVYYHPRRPRIAALEPRVASTLVLWVAIGLFMVGSILTGLLTGT